MIYGQIGAAIGLPHIQRHAVDYFPASYIAFAYQVLPLRPDNRKLYESGRERLKYL